MSNKEAPAAVTGSTTTVKTMADGTLRVSVDVEPRHAQAAFAMFGAPGTPVALARLTPTAAVAESQPKPQEDYGKHYQCLFKTGWFHNPRVVDAFGAEMSMAPDDRVAAIKRYIYDETSSESLKEIEPHFFAQLCDSRGVGDTLPREFRDAA